MRTLALLLTLVTAGACGSIVDPEITVPPDAVMTGPLQEYATWYRAMEICTGVSGDFSLVRWFSVPGERWWDPRWQQYAIGTWRAPHDIYIADAHLDNEFVVKHEMIHDLLRGGHTHDPRFEECSHIAH